MCSFLFLINAVFCLHSLCETHPPAGCRDACWWRQKVSWWRPRPRRWPWRLPGPWARCQDSATVKEKTDRPPQLFSMRCGNVSGFSRVPGNVTPSLWRRRRSPAESLIPPWHEAPPRWHPSRDPLTLLFCRWWRRRQPPPEIKTAELVSSVKFQRHMAPVWRWLGEGYGRLTRWSCWWPTAIDFTVWACRCVLTYEENTTCMV